MFLDKTYFQGDIYLPFLSASAGVTGRAAKNQYVNMDNSVEYFIQKYEPRFLEKLLGPDLAKNFIEGMKAESPLQIWIDLKNALFVETYSQVEQFGYSPAANYVYFYMLRKMRSVTTGKGEAKLTNSTAENVPNTHVLIEAWNDMCYQIQQFFDGFFFKNWIQYKDYAGCRIFSYYRRLYEFKMINEFGI